MTGGRNPRLIAAIAAAVLTGALAVTIAVTTPWRPLAGDGPTVKPDPERDFTAAEIARSRAFDSDLAPPAYLGLALGLLAVLILGFTPLGARLLGQVSKPLRYWPLRVAGASLALSAIVTAVEVPIDIWRENILRRYGLSTQDWGSWTLDQFKSFGVTYVVWLVALLGLHLLIRRFPRHWWAGAAAGGFVLVVAASFAYPVLVEPVFNNFTSMPKSQLRTDLLAMAKRDGVPVKDVLIADASRRTTALNAYVSGFGSTRRIVVYDTLLKQPPEEVELIVAHELGHAKRHDVLHGTLVGALGVAAGTCFLYLLLTSPRCQRRAGVTSPADPRALALLLAGVTVLSQLAAPVQNLVSRHIEARADVHSLDLTGDPAMFIAMQHQLSVSNISDVDPDPLEYVLWASHPSGPQRIAMARTWALRHHRPVPPPLTGQR